MNELDKKNGVCEREPLLTMDTGATIRIKRAAYTHNALAKAYRLQWEDDPSFGEKLKQCAAEQVRCSGDCWKDRLLRFFPFVGILRAYRWRQWLVLDLISGLSVGVIHIPQGMGFSLLTSLPAVYGLYSSFFPVLTYFFFGTSRHISMGTMALISLMIGRVVIREVDKMSIELPSANGTALPDDGNDTSLAAATAAVQRQIDQVRIETAVSVSLLIGAVQFAMGLLGLGSIATFMSMPFIGSFLCGAALHIITSQVPSVFGLAIRKHSGLFRIPLTYYDVCRHLAETNVCAVITAGLALTALVLLKNVVNERCASRLKAPIPAELIVVAVSTLICRYCRLHETYGMAVVGPIPAGLPAPRPPPMRHAVTYVGDAVVAAVVSFVISISMAKLMAKKHGYAIDVNQELYAYGLSHVVGSFFCSFAGAQAPPRTLVHDSVGGKTQLASVVSCVMLLLVCLFLGKLFYSLPVPVLAAVIIVALLPMFRQFQQLPTLWRVNRYDFFVWMITFWSSVLLDITSGLIIGMATSVFVVVFQAHFALGSALVSVDDSDVFLMKDRLTSDRIVEYPGVRVFRFNAPLFFVNVEKFKSQLYRETLPDGGTAHADPRVISTITVEGSANDPNADHSQRTRPADSTVCVDPATSDFRDIPLDRASADAADLGDVPSIGERNGTIDFRGIPRGETSKDFDGIPLDVAASSAAEFHDTGSANHIGAISLDRSSRGKAPPSRAVILDCSAISYIDVMGINMLKMVGSDLAKSGIVFSLACVSPPTLDRLEAAGTLSAGNEDKTQAMFTVYPTVQDAVAMETMKTYQK